MTLLKNSFLLLFLGVLLFWACEPPGFDPVPPRERTYLHVLNANPQLSGVDVEFRTFDEANLIAQNLRFARSWPTTGYASLLTGAKPDSATGPDSLRIVFMDVYQPNTTDSIVPTRALNLSIDGRSTICLIDSFGKPLLVKTVDNYDRPKGDTSNVRFLNLNFNALSVTLETKQTGLQIERLNFLNYSSFSRMPAGVYTFYYKDDFTGRILDSISNFEIEPRHTYSFYFTQDGGQNLGGVEILEQ
ncbi:MAG: hypothetical protein AAF696_30585 [Bacteroidota bacterium]